MKFVTRAPDAKRVELVGETTDWRNGVALTRRDDGTFAAEIDLPPGVYQTKLIVDDAWLLDPENPRTRSAAGSRNNVVAVGAADEPLLFAPGPPWIEPMEDGGLRILLGVRKGAGAPAVTFEEGHGSATVALALAFEEDEHVFFTARLPTSAPEVAITVSAGDATFATRFVRAPARERIPRWWKEAVVYAILVDRFRSGSPRARWEDDPGPGGVAGGDLEGVRRALPELADLGVSVLYLTPVHRGASVHRYDIVDPFVVDPALGGEEAYAALVRDARGRGMRLVQDISFAHVGVGHPAYADVLAHGAASRFASWFVWRDGALVHYGRRSDAPILNLETKDVQAMALDVVERWGRRGASGVRLDMTAEVPFALGRQIRRRFRALVPDGIVVGEVVPQHAWRWRQEGVVDAATDFGFHDAVTDIVCKRASVEATFARIARIDLLRGGDTRASAVRFLSTHDHPRLATLASEVGAKSRLRPAYALLATMPGIPMLLYGEEIGMFSDGARRELEDVWPDRAPMRWALGSRDETFRRDLAKLFAARRASPALVRGDFTVLFADETSVVFRRQSEGDVVDVAVNFDASVKRIAIDDDERPSLELLAETGEAAVEQDTISLPPCSAAILRRGKTRSRVRQNLAIVDHDFVGARSATSARPSRFFFSITERCNLRCGHCITHAPERTKDGTARTMTPAVLDALREDLALGSYFAFVHGGESLTAPIFFDVLEAIRRDRVDPYVAHLLTNGLLLDVETAAKLVAGGVRSISVSLDGATAATNDAIRVGGRFTEVTKRIRDVVAWRRGADADLRIGLSYVVLAQNAGEIAAFVELAAELGVDWVKLEEGVPATAFAERSLVSCAAPHVRSAIEHALARGRDRGLVMVDHTFDRALWRCQLDAEARDFLAADEFANRDRIHPCRSPWDTAFVEPNGDVRIGDFFGPILGNVVAERLAAIWASSEAGNARARSRAARLCGAGPVVCL